MWGSFAKKVTGKAGHVIAQRERLRNEYDKSTTPRHATGILHEIESSFQKKGYLVRELSRSDIVSHEPNIQIFSFSFRAYATGENTTKRMPNLLRQEKSLES